MSLQIPPGSTGPSTPAPTADVAEQFGTGGWAFTPAVVDVFPEHVRASVPFYDAIQGLVAQASDWLLPAGGLVADLGCATGITVRGIMDRHPAREVRAVLYDTESAMLDAALKTLADVSGRVVAHQSPIEQPLHHSDADLTLALFTIQFMPLRDRLAALRNARLCSNESGALIVAEKIRPVDARWAEISTEVSHDWKADHGISPEAIRAKARALRGVLVPYPQSTLMMTVKAAGWCEPEVLFRWHSWIVVGAFATVAGY